MINLCMTLFHPCMMFHSDGDHHGVNDDANSDDSTQSNHTHCDQLAGTPDYHHHHEDDMIKITKLTVDRL